VDITAQKQAEEALRESEAHFRSMFESHRAVMLMIDPKDGRIVEANAAAAGFYGYSQERLRGMHIAEINITLSGELAEEMQIAGPTDRKSYVYPHRLASGEIRSVEVNTSATNVQGRTLLFSIIQDITERLLAEARLEDLNRSLDDKVHQALAELRDKDQMLITQGRQAAMGEMIGNIAHQWRQPLSALSVLLGNLKDAQRFGDLEPELVERTTAEGDLLIQKMSSTIRDFAQFFRPDKAQVVFSALAQIQQALTLMDAGLTSHRIAVEVEAPRDLQLLGYPNEYSQVILNLLSNAQQAIWDTGTQAGRIVISLDSRGATARVTVRDNGGGIPEAILPKIFDPYFSTKEMGTGIGLYMSKQIIEHSMKGRLGARNLGDGAEFTIDTPLAEGPHEP
jgi:PAS domain S-box-containing protein